MLIGVDPGFRKPCAIAWRVDTYSPWQVRCHDWRDALPSDVAEIAAGAAVVVEEPHVRHVRGVRVNPQSIVSLALAAGAVAGAFRQLGAAVVFSQENEWKTVLYRGGGTIEKSVFISRLRRDLALSAEYSDDAVDACGIARYAEFRFAASKRRVFWRSGETVRR